MALHQNLVSLLGESLLEFLTAAEYCVNYQKGARKGACLGFPACTLLLCIIDSIGSYYRGNKQFAITVDGKKTWIKNDSQHFLILNSKFYGQALSGIIIKTLYDHFRNPLMHNTALMPEHALVYHPDLPEPFIILNDIPHINVCGLLQVSKDAVKAFLNDVDSVVPESDQVKLIDRKMKHFFGNKRNT